MLDLRSDVASGSRSISRARRKLERGTNADEIAVSYLAVALSR